jgi:hypothetical protein
MYEIGLVSCFWGDDLKCKGWGLSHRLLNNKYKKQ